MTRSGAKLQKKGLRLLTLSGLFVVVGSAEVVVGSAEAAAQVANLDEQIAQAVLAAPDDLKDGAKVLGYAEDGAVVELRAGSNDFTCLADNPADERFGSSCFHNSLEPYFARGRELDAEGAPRQQRYQTRWNEITAGTLPGPDHSATQYLFSGTWDPATRTAEGTVRWVIYVPGATTESTGLTTTPIEGGPWLMFAGTPGAHIMIVPPGE